MYKQGIGIISALLLISQTFWYIIACRPSVTTCVSHSWEALKKHYIVKAHTTEA
jgi:hypothetical protein